MARYNKFVNWKNQYCENEYTNQGNLQIQCNSYQITNGIFHRTRKKFQNLYRDTKDPKQKNNLEKENGAGEIKTPQLQIVLQSYNHENSMILAEKQKYRSMEQDRKSRNEPMYLWSTNP